jgi:hypothetical protein
MIAAIAATSLITSGVPGQAAPRSIIADWNRRVWINDLRQSCRDRDKDLSQRETGDAGSSQ